VIEYIVPLLALRGPFSKQSPRTRRRIIERYLIGPRAGRLLRNLAKIRTLFLLAYYGDPRVYPSIHFKPPPEQGRYRPGALRPLEPPTPTVAPPAVGEATIVPDLCVIAAGRSRAAVGYSAAAPGARV